MKKAISVILSAALIISCIFYLNIFPAVADDSGTCGASGSSVSYNYNSDTKTLTISGTGATKNYGQTGSNRPPWYSYKTEITTVVIDEGITTLGYLNFYACTALTSVSLPSTLTTISGGTLDYGAFRECTALEKITLPSGLETIGAMAFHDCTALKSVTLPNSLTSIDSYAFQDCSSLQSITFPDSLTSVGNYAFQGCSSLESVTYGTGMTSTGAYAFYESGVKKIKFSPTITAIDNYSFFNTKLSTVEIPETVTSIGTRAFANCSFLYSVTVYNSNCTFSGDPFNGSSQSTVTFYGHSQSTTQTYAEETSDKYVFVSIDECAHTSTHEVITQEPTCTETGITTQVCDNCGFVVSETQLAANGHTYELIEESDDTQSNGHIFRYYKCTVCNDEMSEIEHVEYVEGFYTETVIKTGSCTESGISRYTCNIEGCGKSKTVYTPKGNHQVDSYTVIAAATCTEDGSEEGVCTLCGETVTQVISATGHTDELQSTEENAQDGHTYETYQCSVCSAVTIKAIHNEWVDGCYTSAVVTNPTCTIDGIQRDTCDICGETRLVTIPANGAHVWYETSRTEPTCTATGTIYYACENCTLTKNESIAALGHELELTASEDATCTTAGYNRYKCTRSGCSYATTETVAAKGHTAAEDSMVVEKAATCEESGTVSAVCSVCGEAFEITEAALGHDYTDVITDIEDKPGHVLSTPTCTRCGTTDKSETVHQEWIEGYYETKVVTEGSCTVARVTTDTCTLCSVTRTNTQAAPGHSYSYSGTDESGSFVYICSSCNNAVTRTPSALKLLWSTKYINKSPDDSSLTNGYYFELNCDGIINAKDYAILNKAYNTAQQAKS